MFLPEFVYIRFTIKYISYCGAESHIEITLQRLSEWAGGEPDWAPKCPRMNQIEGHPTEHMATVGETHLLQLGPSWDDRCANMRAHCCQHRPGTKRGLPAEKEPKVQGPASASLHPLPRLSSP